MMRLALKAMVKRSSGCATFCILGLCMVADTSLFAQAAASNEDGPAASTPEFSRPAQTSTAPRLIDNATIIRMAQAGLEEAILLQTIELQPGHYDTSPDALIQLKTAGVPQKVIATMQAYGTGLHVRSSSASVRPISQPATPKPIDPISSAPGVDEIGIYYRATKGEQAGQWLPLQTERVVFKSGGAAKSILTHGIISKDMNGHLNGPSSALTLQTGTEILIYAPLGTDANEYDFLRLQEHKDNREFRTLTGGVFHSESGPERNELEFHPKKIAAQMYTFTVPADIEKGEYGVLPPGSANTQGLAGTGKIFTFAIRE